MALHRFGVLCAVLLAAAAARAQEPAGGEFRVNAYTTGGQAGGSAAFDRLGRFTITWTWTSGGQDGVAASVRGQRFGADGGPRGGEFCVDTAGGLAADVAVGEGGGFLVAWQTPAGPPPTVPDRDVEARRFGPDGAPRGNVFRVNTYTTQEQLAASASALGGGRFVVVWEHDPVLDPPFHDRIVSQRYGAYGTPLGGEVDASSLQGSADASGPAVAGGPDGGYAVVWAETSAQNGTVMARFYDPAGAAIGAPFAVHSTPRRGEGWPSVARDGEGRVVVAWEHLVDDTLMAIRARRFTASGTPLGDDFAVNTGTMMARLPHVATDTRGNFVVAWTSFADYTFYEVHARRFSAAGAPRGGDFLASATTVGYRATTDVASDEVGNFLVTWSARPGGGDHDVFAQRFGGLRPMAAGVDGVASAGSDGNGVLEAGEAVTFEPSWRNVNGAVQTFTGQLPRFTGPAGATYSIVDGSADYGTVADGGTAACKDCYRISVSAPAVRPAMHWDALADEDLAPEAQGQRQRWRVHIGDTFADVPRSSGYYRAVETLVHHSVTAGCSAGHYCPQAPMTREQLAVSLLVARDAAGDPPPACTTPLFSDVPATSPYCRWIEELARSGVVSGCGNGNFCPADSVTREQMAVFVLRTLDGTLAPPACTAPLFADVPASSPYCRWIEELARRGVVGGCGGGNYCPHDPVTREQTAVYVSATFGLSLYGP